jgi:hypothetical protein
MISLDTLQHVLCEAVRSPSPGTDHGVADRAAALVAPSHRGMTAAERVEVYREQFWLRHLSNLEEDYPTLRWAIGAAPLRELAAEYLRAFPPRAWNLERLGQDLPSFLKRAHPEHGELALDAARLDWAFMEAFGAPDAPPFDDRLLASTPEDAWPGARIVFHPSLGALALSHAVHTLRDAIQSGATQLQRPAPSDTRLVVWRDRACYLRNAAIEPLAFELLCALRDGAPLGEACERAAASDPTRNEAELGPRIAGWFQEWTANGWVAAVRLPGN